MPASGGRAANGTGAQGGFYHTSPRVSAEQLYREGAVAVTGPAAQNGGSERQIKIIPMGLWRTLAEYSADALILMNRVRRVLYMNRAARELLGEERVGGLCGDLLGCREEETCHLTDSSACFGQCVLQSRRPLTDVEMTIVRGDGEVIPVAVSYSYIPDENGEDYFLMAIRDQTDRKVSEAEHQRSEELRLTLRERERLARDLHDGVVQDVAYANLQVKNLLGDGELEQTLRNELTAVSRVLEQSYQELRQALFDLTFHVRGSLADHLRKHLDDFEAQTGIATQLREQDVPLDLEPFTVDQICKMLREALANVRKHAHAHSVSVDLTCREEFLTCEIVDDGQGFTDMEFGNIHFGLRVMRERCGILGGELQVKSSPGHGTQITIVVPVRR